MPPNSATCATKRWAAVSRLSGSLVRCSASVRVTIVMASDLPQAPRSRPRLDDHLATHGVVRNSTIFMARDEILAHPVEARRHARNLARDQHDIDVDAGDEETVDHVPAGGDERHGGAHRHMDFVGGERPDLADHSDFIAERPGLHDAALVDGRGLEYLCWIHAARHARHVDTSPEGSHEEGGEHPDRNGDARKNPC